MTEELALSKAKEELALSIYLQEVSPNSGLSTIHSNRCEWLSMIISMAEKKYSPWVDCSLIMPESLPENEGKKVIPCIVAVKSVYPNGKPNIEKRMRQRTDRDGVERFGDSPKWEWSKCRKDRVTHWMPLPYPPEVNK